MSSLIFNLWNFNKFASVWKSVLVYVNLIAKIGALCGLIYINSRFCMLLVTHSFELKLTG